MSDGITAYFLTFDGQAVYVNTMDGFCTPSFSPWNLGVCDVTIFPSRELAEAQVKTLCQRRTAEWRSRFDVRRIYAPFPETSR